MLSGVHSETPDGHHHSVKEPFPNDNALVTRMLITIICAMTIHLGQIDTQ
ncbi:MAG: hypothetical protein PWP34_2022 [Desulfuromonadales bacterium]|jgi:hypothetical protein|nr:hypothetical protein [Desulfuromonadales bacterium]